MKKVKAFNKVHSSEEDKIGSCKFECRDKVEGFIAAGPVRRFNRSRPVLAFPIGSVLAVGRTPVNCLRGRKRRDSDRADIEGPVIPGF